MLVSLALLIVMIGSDCFGYNYNAQVVNNDNVGCGFCPAVYARGEEHSCSGSKAAKSGTQTYYSDGQVYVECGKCNTRYMSHIRHICPDERTTSTLTYSGSSKQLPSALPPKNTATLRSVCGNCGYSSNNCRCGGNSPSWIKVFVRNIFVKRGYRPSQRRINNVINTITGGQLEYPDKNFGWKSGNNNNNRVVFVGRYPVRGYVSGRVR